MAAAMVAAAVVAAAVVAAATVAAAMVVAATVVAATVVVAMVMAWRRFYGLVEERQKALVWVRCRPQVHFLGRKTLPC